MLWRSALRPLLVSLDCEGYSSKQWSETEGKHLTGLLWGVRCEGYSSKQWSETEGKHLTGLLCAVRDTAINSGVRLRENISLDCFAL